jgi:putative Mn2+ efflux pump MntP
VQLLSYGLVAVGLAMDAMEVSLSVGTTTLANSFRAKFRLAFHFGLFQMLMTILGWFTGSTIAGNINKFDDWLALGLLGYVGLNMVHSGLDKNGQTYLKDPSKGRTLLILCVATSLDAMAVGIGMAMLQTSVWVPAIIIGIVTLALSSLGLAAGKRLGITFGKKMEVVGGIILIIIGLQAVIGHIFPHFL